MDKSKLPDSFLFTQYSLNTFEACPIKFKKRYIDRLGWAGILDKDKAKSLETGRNFHLLAYRYFMGIDSGLEKDVDECGQLESWFNALKRDFKIIPGLRYLPEYKLRMTKPPMMLEANFDLLIAGDNEIQIWDWKTHGSNDLRIRAKTAENYKKSLQTKVYMFVLKEMVKLAVGREVEFDKISMNYWQPDDKGVLTEIRYSRDLHERFKTELNNRIKTITSYDYSGFNRIEYIKQCKRCEFKCLCDRENSHI